MSGHDQAVAISKIEIELANARAGYEAWSVENASMAGQPDYEKYVNDFRNWEARMESQLAELRNAISRKRVADIPTLPQKSLDEQIADLVKDIQINDFVKGLMALVEKDPNFVARLTQLVQRETQGIYYNPQVPPPVIPAHAVPSIPSYNGAQIPLSYQPSHVPTTFLGINKTSMRPIGPSAHLQQPIYNQQTSHGVIPDTWVVDEPVRRQKRSPIPERQHLPKLPYKDFSQT